MLFSDFFCDTFMSKIMTHATGIDGDINSPEPTYSHRTLGGIPVGEFLLSKMESPTCPSWNPDPVALLLPPPELINSYSKHSMIFLLMLTCPPKKKC